MTDVHPCFLLQQSELKSLWLLDFSVVYLDKTKIIEKEAGVGPFLEEKYSSQSFQISGYYERI